MVVAAATTRTTTVAAAAAAAASTRTATKAVTTTTKTAKTSSKTGKATAVTGKATAVTGKATVVTGKATVMMGGKNTTKIEAKFEGAFSTYVTAVSMVTLPARCYKVKYTTPKTTTERWSPKLKKCNTASKMVESANATTTTMKVNSRCGEISNNTKSDDNCSEYPSCNSKAVQNMRSDLNTADGGGAHLSSSNAIVKASKSPGRQMDVGPKEWLVSPCFWKPSAVTVTASPVLAVTPGQKKTVTPPPSSSVTAAPQSEFEDSLRPPNSNDRIA